jgi:DNA-binding GntR family transcriptional regulator
VFDVSVKVMTHAREELKRRGLVVVIRGYGTFTRAIAEKQPE